MREKLRRISHSSKSRSQGLQKVQRDAELEALRNRVRELTDKMASMLDPSDAKALRRELKEQRSVVRSQETELEVLEARNDALAKQLTGTYSEKQITELLVRAETANRDADKYAQEVHGLERLVSSLKAENSRLQDRMKQQDNGVATAEAPELSMRSQVQAAWEERTPEAERHLKVMDPYRLLDGFEESIEQAGMDRGKVASVMFEVLTGVAQNLRSRGMHPMAKPGAVYEKHEELGTLWRVYLQQKTASARRMHIYRDSDGVWSFKNVELHDGFDGN